MPLPRPPTRVRRRADASAPGATGRLGERAAAAHLRRLGYEILARNLRTGAGEIDVIAADSATIVFVEVKTTVVASEQRSDRDAAAERLGGALERISRQQRRRLRGLALDWLRSQPAAVRSGRELRFDAVAVVLDGERRVLALEHLEAAW